MKTNKISASSPRGFILLCTTPRETSPCRSRVADTPDSSGEEQLETVQVCSRVLTAF